MSKYTPTTERVLTYIRGNAVMAGASSEEAGLAADKWLAEVERAAAEKALDAVKADVWRERSERDNKYPDYHYGGMMHANTIIGNAIRALVPNPYRKEDGNE